MTVMRRRKTKPATAPKSSHLALRPATVEKVFHGCVMDLKKVVVLDRINILPDAFRVRGHDLHGPLPEIVIEVSGDTFLDKDRLADAACKLISIVGLREEMIRSIPGGRFLPPTTMDRKAIVGIVKGQETWVAEGRDFLAAHHRLHDKVMD